MITKNDELPLEWEHFKHVDYGCKIPDFRILQGDCMERLKEIEDNSVDAIFADPPYFLSNGGISVQSGKQVCVDKGEWDKGGTPEYIYKFNRRWLELCRPKLKENGTIWISGTHHNIHVVMRCLQELGYKVLNTITWQKTDPPPNLSCKYFNFSTELIIWARKSQKVTHKFNYETMKQLNGGTQMTDVWRIPAVGSWEKLQGKHPTQKPLRLLYRIILASTNEGDTILDPFAGSSTTGIAANLLERKFIGIEQESQFADLSLRRRQALEDAQARDRLYDKMRENAQEATILVNHMREKDRELAMQLGMTYLRAGDSKGSLLVKQGFERLGYICLHTNGDHPQLFGLTKKGFQIWTAEALREKGFTAENAPYYAVLHFDPARPVLFDKKINLHMRKYTQVAHIHRYSDFITIK
ncbi:MAG: site-specific DNA-methyltransferase [Paludibacteraceae bacterium]|nr:site-specific DNA-methyltransferase [Paludibacteraceae bacterium]